MIYLYSPIVGLCILSSIYQIRTYEGDETQDSTFKIVLIAVIVFCAQSISGEVRERSFPI
jgi:hypothetical protein